MKYEDKKGKIYKVLLVTIRILDFILMGNGKHWKFVAN